VEGTFSIYVSETSVNVYESGTIAYLIVVELVANVPTAVAVIVAVVNDDVDVGTPARRTRFVVTLDSVTPVGNPDAVKTTLHPDNV
jgi:hypothetical protein